jgi:hypothetical protein
MRHLANIFRHPGRHRKGQDMPGYIQRRMYRQLIDLLEQEAEVARMLDLDVSPRISVVDEEYVAIIRARDRDDPEVEKVLREMRDRLHGGGARE